MKDGLGFVDCSSNLLKNVPREIAVEIFMGEPICMGSPRPTSGRQTPPRRREG